MSERGYSLNRFASLFVHGDKVIHCIYGLSMIHTGYAWSLHWKETQEFMLENRPPVISPSHQVHCCVKREKRPEQFTVPQPVCLPPISLRECWGVVIIFGDFSLIPFVVIVEATVNKVMALSLGKNVITQSLLIWERNCKTHCKTKTSDSETSHFLVWDLLLLFL